MKKIRVLHVIAGMNMGGAETFLMNIFRNINRNKFEFYFLCYGTKKFDYEDEIQKLGGHIIRIDIPRFMNFNKAISNIKRIIKENKIDIVHSHTYYNSMFATYAAHQCNVQKIITHSHSTFSEHNISIMKKMYFCIAKYIINKYSNIRLACGKEAGEALFGSKNKFIIIYNGIDIDKFVFDKNIRNDKRRELDIKNNEFVIGHVGRFDKVKNHIFLLRIFKEFLKLRANTKLILIGDGILKDEIKNRTCKLGIEKNVIFLEKRKDVNYLYSSMDILLFPSLYEGIPITLIEAQTNGLPIIASDTIDSNVNITNKINFFSLNNTASEWALKLNQKIGIRYDYTEKIRKSEYNMKENIFKLEKIYEKG